MKQKIVSIRKVKPHQHYLGGELSSELTLACGHVLLRTASDMKKKKVDWALCRECRRLHGESLKRAGSYAI